jgi:hypothetical protein
MIDAGPARWGHVRTAPTRPAQLARDVAARGDSGRSSAALRIGPPDRYQVRRSVQLASLPDNAGV